MSNIRILTNAGFCPDRYYRHCSENSLNLFSVSQKDDIFMFKYTNSPNSI